MEISGSDRRAARTKDALAARRRLDPGVVGAHRFRASAKALRRAARQRGALRGRDQPARAQFEATSAGARACSARPSSASHPRSRL